nr:A-kinase anchor protein inhibitor 1 [Globicephala melas]
MHFFTLTHIQGVHGDVLRDPVLLRECQRSTSELLHWMRACFLHPHRHPVLCPPGGLGEKPGSEPEEAKLQIASKQIVQNAILRAVQQVSRESRQREAGAGDTPRGSFRPGAGELTKKHEKK